MPGAHGTLEERFWPKVARGSRRECWLWTANKNNKGYGMLGRGAAGTGMVLAHRVAWELHRGPVPKGKWVLHRCDNPLCVNPAHLFLGDHVENVRDMHRKGRGRAKLTPADVRTIYRLKKKGEQTADLVAQYGVNKSTINRIARNATWDCLRRGVNL